MNLKGTVLPYVAGDVSHEVLFNGFVNTAVTLTIVIANVYTPLVSQGKVETFLVMSIPSTTCKRRTYP